MIDDSTERQVVRKSYELITAKNKWSEIESKLLATFIKELNPKSERDFKELNISIESIEKLWGVKINTTNLRNLCIELKRKVYEIPEYKVINEKIDYTKIKAYDYVSLFSDIKYHLEAKYISFEFDKKMHPHLIDFTRFVKYRIENILQFKSNYSISKIIKCFMFKRFFNTYANLKKISSFVVSDSIVFLNLKISVNSFNLLAIIPTSSLKVVEILYE